MAIPAPGKHPPDLDETRNPWSCRRRTPKYGNAWIDVTEHEVTDPGGRPGIYGVVHMRNLALGVVPICDDGSVILVGQYRYTLDRYFWEIPEGGGSPGVPAMESAQRELAEETGLAAAHWQELVRMHLSNSVSDELSVTYVAWGLHLHSFAGVEADSTEELAIWRLPFGQAVAMAEDGRLTDSMTVAGLFALDRLRLLNRLPDGLRNRLDPVRSAR